ncbi:unnamed protein product [Malus baccata var. baccata]
MKIGAEISKYMTSTFTLWMKSLVMQGNGCTAFDANGQVVYRIDNYDDNKHGADKHASVGVGQQRKQQVVRNCKNGKLEASEIFFICN